MKHKHFQDTSSPEEFMLKLPDFDEALSQERNVAEASGEVKSKSLFTEMFLCS